MRSNFKITGMKDLEKSLKRIEKKIQDQVSGEVTFDVLFNKRFMKLYTKFNDIEEFFQASPFNIQSQEDFENINEAELDKYVSEHTKFRTWEDMNKKALEEYVKSKLK